MTERPLRYRLLSAPFLFNCYAAGDKACDYEKYLIEMLNSSSWVSDHFSTRFLPSSSQAHGECDAYSGKYGLDFKLIASKTALQAKRIHSFQIEKMDDGAYAYCSPRDNRSMQITRFPQAIRGRSIDELLAIRERATKKQGVDNDIAEYLGTLQTDKHLLLFFPYRFQYDEPSKVYDDIISIVHLCSEDFSASLNYRANILPNRDTFFVFLYDYHFALCKWDKGTLVLIEAIPVEKSETFMHVALTYCSTEWGEKYDVLLQELKKEQKQVSGLEKNTF